MSRAKRLLPLDSLSLYYVALRGLLRDSIVLSCSFLVHPLQLVYVVAPSLCPRRKQCTFQIRFGRWSCPNNIKIRLVDNVPDFFVCTQLWQPVSSGFFRRFSWSCINRIRIQSGDCSHCYPDSYGWFALVLAALRHGGIRISAKLLNFLPSAVINYVQLCRYQLP